MLGKIERVTLGQKVLFYAVMILLSAVMIYPFFFLVTTSLKDSPEVFTNILQPFGERLRFDNYATVLGTVNMGRYLVNTAIVAIGVTVGQIVTSILGGYSFARLSFPGRDLIFRAYLGTMMIPFVVIMIPTYKLMLVFGWVDKLAALIVPWIFTAYGTFLMRQFFAGLPKELEEAALIDGASRFTTLWRIFVPLAGPAIATQFTISFLYAWNSFIWPLVAIQSKNNYVVTLGLADIQGGYHAQPPVVMAGATLAILPTVLVFLMAQRYFVEGVATTGLKG
jgi:multiple sugar transport system permease protein